MPSDDPLEIFAFNLTENKACRRVDEHKIYNITEEEVKKLQDEAEKLLKELEIPWYTLNTWYRSKGTPRQLQFFNGKARPFKQPLKTHSLNN